MVLFVCFVSKDDPTSFSFEKLISHLNQSALKSELPAFKSKSSNPQVVASLAAIALSALEMFTSYCVWRSSLALIAPRSLESKQHLATHFLNLNLYFKVPESPLVFVCMINMIEH